MSGLLLGFRFCGCRTSPWQSHFIANTDSWFTYQVLVLEVSRITEFTREGTERIGRQQQTWVRFACGWRCAYRAYNVPYALRLL